jgi:hypothetical protein
VTRRKPASDFWVHVLAAAILIGLFGACEVASCFYARWVYSDWKCGLPGVHCRKEKP